MQIKYKYNNDWQTLSLTSLGMGTIGAKNTLTPADIPNLDIGKITNLQTTLNGKSDTDHTHSYLYTSDDLHRMYISTNNNIFIQDRSTTSDSYTTAGYAAISSVIPTASTQQAANKVFATPNGSNGYPSIRALVADDIPNLSADKITSGTLNASRIPDLSGSYLPLSGGALTGTLTVNGQANAYIIKSNSADRDGTAPSSITVYNNIVYTDKDDEKLARIYDYINSNGRVGLQLHAVNEKTDGTEVSNSLVIGTNKDGSAYYGVSDAEAFRSAISAAAFDHTHDNATQSAAGFMSSTDKTKLDTTISYDSNITRIRNGSQLNSVALNSSGNLQFYETKTATTDSWTTVGYAAINTTNPRATAQIAANKVLATPTNSSGLPNMRSLVADDIPTLSVSKIENAVAANASTETATLAGDEYMFVTKVGGDSTTWRRRTLKGAILPYIKSAWALGQTEATITVAKGTTASNSYGYAGTRVTGVSVTNSSANNIFSIALQPGVWVVSYGATFSSNATGRRFIILATSTTGVTQNAYSSAVSSAISGANTTVQGNTLIDISSAKTYYVNVWQNSGAALSDCEVWVGAVKVA